jgi:hypothetical protein
LHGEQLPRSEMKVEIDENARLGHAVPILPNGYAAWVYVLRLFRLLRQ